MTSCSKHVERVFVKPTHLFLRTMSHWVSEVYGASVTVALILVFYRSSTVVILFFYVRVLSVLHTSSPTGMVLALSLESFGQSSLPALFEILLRVVLQLSRVIHTYNMSMSLCIFYFKIG